jgi:hypothetical protein
MRVLRSVTIPRLPGKSATPTATPAGMPKMAANRVDQRETTTDTVTALTTSGPKAVMSPSAVLSDSLKKFMFAYLQNRNPPQRHGDTEDITEKNLIKGIYATDQE